MKLFSKYIILYVITRENSNLSIACNK